MRCIVTLLLSAVGLELVASYSWSRSCSLPAYREKSWLRASPSEEDNDNGGITKYWEVNSVKWEKTLRILDVRAAYASGSLNGILPSGRPSRGAPNERLISLSRALELFEKDEKAFPVRRRFRQMKLEELRPRWDSVISKRATLQAAGQWEVAVDESEKYRAFEKSLVEGGVESSEASPAYSRAVVAILSPALKAAAKQRTRSDGGIKATQVELLQSAGSTPDERWLTAALLAELEEEFSKTFSTMVQPTSSSRSLFAEDEAEKDIEDAGSGAFLGVLLAIVTAVLVSFLQ